MPTKEELEELANKCTRTETTLNGKACMMFTGPNGNSLYLPKGGFGDEGNGAGLNGYGLWSSTEVVLMHTGLGNGLILVIHGCGKVFLFVLSHR